MSGQSNVRFQAFDFLCEGYCQSSMMLWIVGAVMRMTRCGVCGVSLFGGHRLLTLSRALLLESFSISFACDSLGRSSAYL